MDVFGVAIILPTTGPFQPSPDHSNLSARNGRREDNHMRMDANIDLHMNIRVHLY